MEPFISGVTQLFWDLLNDCAGFYHIVYNPNPITKPNGFDNPLPTVSITVIIYLNLL